MLNNKKKEIKLVNISHCFVLLSLISLVAFAKQVDLYKFNVKDSIPAPERSHLIIGPSDPVGPVWDCTSRYITKDGKPFMLVMGEFQFSRYPAQEWETELIKMKAGGVDIVATYLFWIHHEEIKGVFDFSGQRDIRRFIELCSKHDLYVWVRIGPWCHGEARNQRYRRQTLYNTESRLTVVEINQTEPGI